MTARPITGIDRRVADRIRAARIAAGMTQQQFAELIGVTYQQAHKYEAAMNRVSAGRLYQIARVLERPVASFFPLDDTLEEPERFAHPKAMRELSEILRRGLTPEHVYALMLVARCFAAAARAERP